MRTATRIAKVSGEDVGTMPGKAGADSRRTLRDDLTSSDSPTNGSLTSAYCSLTAMEMEDSGETAPALWIRGSFPSCTEKETAMPKENPNSKASQNAWGCKGLHEVLHFQEALTLHGGLVLYELMSEFFRMLLSCKQMYRDS